MSVTSAKFFAPIGRRLLEESFFFDALEFITGSKGGPSLMQKSPSLHLIPRPFLL
jgi:hypothetical protein